MLTPGQRVRLIRALVPAMEGRHWPEVQLALQQFGMPNLYSLEEEEPEFLTRVLGEADDLALEGLREYFIGEGDQEEPAPTRVPWQPGYFRLFLSHVHAHRKFVADLKGDLANYGIDAFVAHSDIAPTREWLDEIELALRTGDALAALLHPEFQASAWTDQEVGYAIARQVKIIPVALGTMPYGFMDRWQAIRAETMDSPALARNMFGTLIAHELTATRAAEGLVTAFEHSSSFNEANSLSSLLSDVRWWTPELLRRIRDAVASNSQVSSAWYAPERVDEILKRHREETDEPPL